MKPISACIAFKKQSISGFFTKTPRAPPSKTAGSTTPSTADTSAVNISDDECKIAEVVKEGQSKKISEGNGNYLNKRLKKVELKAPPPKKAAPKKASAGPRGTFNKQFRCK